MDVLPFHKIGGKATDQKTKLVFRRGPIEHVHNSQLRRGKGGELGGEACQRANGQLDNALIVPAQQGDFRKKHTLLGGIGGVESYGFTDKTRTKKRWLIFRILGERRSVFDVQERGSLRRNGGEKGLLEEKREVNALLSR